VPPSAETGVYDQDKRRTRLNLDEALIKDGELRPKLLAAIAGKYQLEAKAIGKPDACTLGNWLHGEAERNFPFLKSYRPCVDAHVAFHAEMEKVVRQINLEEYASAEAMLANGTPCSKAFVAMVAAVRQLKKDAKL
jgi:hypothetical protein